MLPYFSCTTADFEIQYFFNKVTVGVLVNTGLIFYDSSKLDYLTSKLMLRWDSHFNNAYTYVARSEIPKYCKHAPSFQDWQPSTSDP